MTARGITKVNPPVRGGRPVMYPLPPTRVAGVRPRVVTGIRWSPGSRAVGQNDGDGRGDSLYRSPGGRIVGSGMCGGCGCLADWWQSLDNFIVRWCDIV